jgi:hypothetical protein
MFYFSSNTRIDGYQEISSIDVNDLKEWWKVLLLVFSNLFAIFPIIYAYIMGYYLWGTSIFVAMLVSMGYHLCQTTDFCIFGMNLNTWQETDHITAATILAMSILILFLYRPIKNKNKYGEDNGIISNKYGNLSPDQKLSFDKNLRLRDKTKICFNCRGVDPIMIYDWQSEVIVFIYIFVIVITINALPLTTQSFLIVIIFGLLYALLKIVVFEEGDPSYLKERFHLPSLIIGIVFIIISLIFYFIDGYILYWLFHPLWHLFSFIGFLFFVIGISKDLDGWFNFNDILRFLLKRTKSCLTICCCCKFRKKKKESLLPLTRKDVDNDGIIYKKKDLIFVNSNNILIQY